jgi:hypothetical protein
VSKARLEQADLDKFEMFLVDMPDALEQFTQAAAAAGFHLDYSLESLGQLEQWVLAHRLTGDDTSLFDNRSARYLGEVFRQNLGGTWKLCLKDPRHLFFKLPVITDFSEKDLDFCPIEVMANFAHHPKEGALRRVVASWTPYVRK